MLKINLNCSNCVWYKKTSYKMHGSVSGYVEHICRHPTHLKQDIPFTFQTKESCKYYKLSIYRLFRQLMFKKR